MSRHHQRLFWTEEEASNKISEFLIEIAEATDHMGLIEVRNRMQLAYGTAVPQELKDAWKIRKQETR